ncbi:MAG: T9SS type A sorting domain-containing protein [Bacteroidetes bacterium]|nr:T9SS type A sorting domain-containing protein [Bacteroidota bacterium]
MKSIFVIAFSLVYLCCSAQNWTLYGPSGLHANNITFGAGVHNNDVICTNTGICINDGAGGSWNTYPAGLPVWEAIRFDADNILLVMGDGSYSDGIYKFNLGTLMYEIVGYCYIPTFIRFCTSNNLYYVGTRYNSLLISSDGAVWDSVPYFSGKACAAMDYYESHVAAVQENNIYATYYSSDAGISWSQSASTIPIHDLAFNASGDLYGVFTGFSNSSGLYSSPDFGETWNLEQWSDEMNTVGFDVVGNIFAGWHSSTIPSPGVAIYDPVSHDFNFISENLPNKNIHKFKVNPVLSSMTIFACTDTGVYYSNDYLSAIGETEVNRVRAIVSPNPFNTTATVRTTLKDGFVIEVYDPFGRRVLQDISMSNNYLILKGKLSAGMYFYKIRSSDEVFATGKIIISNLR